MRLALVLAVLLPVAARCECSVTRAALLPLTLWQEKLYVQADINGSAARLFIDTGAAVTTFSQPLADGLNLPRNFDHAADAFGVGGMESHLTIVEAASFTLAGIRFAHKAFPVARFGEVLADGTPAGGLIGADILSQFDVELDVPNRSLGLWRVQGCDDFRPDWPSEPASVALTVLPSRHVTVPVRVNGAALELMLDTGAPGLVLSTRAAARAGADAQILEQNRSLEGRGVNERAFPAWLHIFERVDVGGRIFGDVRGIVVSGGRLQTGDGLLGLAFLKHGRAWISYATGKLFLARTED